MCEYKSAHAPLAVLSTLRAQVFELLWPRPVPLRGVVQVTCLVQPEVHISALRIPILSARTHLPQVLSCIVRVEKKIYKFFLSHSLPGHFLATARLTFGRRSLKAIGKIFS